MRFFLKTWTQGIGFYGQVLTVFTTSKLVIELIFKKYKKIYKIFLQIFLQIFLRQSLNK